MPAPTNQLMRQINQGLENIVKVIRDGFGNMVSKMITANELNEQFKRTNKFMLDGHSKIMEATVMTALLDKASKITATKNLIELAQKRIHKRTARYEKQIDKITNRSNDRIDKIKGIARDHIQQLDSSIMELLDRYADEEIAARYTVASYPSWDYIEKQNTQNNRLRDSIFAIITEETRESASAFINLRQNFNRLAESTTHPDGAAGSYYVPFIKTEYDTYIMPRMDSVSKSISSCAPGLSNFIEDDIEDVETGNSHSRTEQLGEAVNELLDDPTSYPKMTEKKKRYIRAAVERGVNKGLIEIMVPGGSSEAYGE